MIYLSEEQKQAASLGSGGPVGLPIGIGNKVDIAAKEGIRGSSGTLVDACCFHQERNFH
ncbi:ras-related small GTP-binding family protein [Actinidia rufa]|uniref:Ras-related small GTP-binding family protein n=1 Tax=Actinidia rufa TaxID=165716 RepID=A0A7J0G9P9_9ERIC|nr:ras-related small GTP-binding family protein [Actinidia rufa]